jgi:8-oxo-dGTP diphosphatase
VGALVRDGGGLDAAARVLVARRRPAQGRDSEALWEFPGGKVRQGESDRDALARELLEELGVASVVGPLLCEVLAPPRGGPSAPAIRLLLREVCLLGHPIPLEHEALAWLSWTQIEQLALTPADAMAVARLRCAPEGGGTVSKGPDQAMEAVEPGFLLRS